MTIRIGVLAALLASLYWCHPSFAQQKFNHADTKIDIPAGMKIISIKTPSSDALSGILEPGDKVDVCGLWRNPTNAGLGVQTIKKDVRVFSVDTKMDDLATRVGLLVDEATTETIFYAMKHGRVKLSLRGELPAIDDFEAFENQTISARWTRDENTDRRKSVREIAIQLDSISAQLEDLQLYERADELRNTAQQLRLEARAPIGSQ